MKKFLVCLIGIIFIFTASVYPSNQWQEGTGQDTILGSISPSDIDKDSFENIVNPLDRMLANYQAGCNIEYLSASTLTVKAGEVMLSNSDGSIRLMQQNTSDITVTWGDIDTDEEASSTTYYVYAFQEIVTTATFSVTISTSASAPSGKTYYARLGSFYNDSSSNIVNDNTIVNDYSAFSPKQYGDWSSKSFDTSYQATTDGFVVAFMYTLTNDVTANISGYSDSSNPPTTLRGISGIPSGDSAKNDTDDRWSIGFPVKLGDYYKIAAENENTSTSKIYFIPHS